MDTRKVPVFCYWNGCIKDGPDGPFYEGSSPRVIRVESKIKLSTLLDGLHRLTGFQRGKFHIDLIGRYPSIVQQPMVKYMRLPIVDDCSLETMLEVPSYNPSVNNVEFYLEIKPVVSDRSLLANHATRKRSRQEDANVDAHGNVSMRNTTRRSPPEDKNDGRVKDEKIMDDGNNEAVEKDSKMKKLSLTIDLCVSVPKQMILSSTWLDERELHVGMVFGDKDELVKAVKLYSDRRQRKYRADECLSTFQCSRGCIWVLKVAETKSNGFKITEYSGPHTCQPADVGSDFLAGEIQGLIKAQPSLSIADMFAWVKGDFGYTVSHSIMSDAKKKATVAILGDLDKSFSVLPKLMAALCSSNKMVLDWQYDSFPDPKDASFRSVFWAFQQSIEGFPHCRPLIIVDTVDLSGNHPAKLLVAAGRDAESMIFPLAFAIITQESLSADNWRWFFACIREKVTQRNGLCLITSLNPDIVAVVKEPECQWAQHRFCLRHLCYKFYDVFSNNLMTEFVFKAGTTTYEPLCDYYLAKIEGMNPDARKWLDEIPLHQWALAHDDGGLRYGIRTTNIIYRTYDFINKALDLPITTCILLIFDHLAELFKFRRGHPGESLNGKDLYAEQVMTHFEAYKVASTTHNVLPLDFTREKFEVMHQDGKLSFVVHRSDRLCTCGNWQLHKIPCSHVIAVCRRLNIDHMQYVDDFYRTENFLAVYATDFNPLPGVADWPEASLVPRLFPPGSSPISAEPRKKVTGEKRRSKTGKKKKERSEVLKTEPEPNREDVSVC
ncbi:Zinc finger PMZ-type [Arabidopsis thaliana x Arabidopsis arenosa]|uniref:Zinc finger PMZ-type n=1 Tax=Arabidopsis thaliana x Arabidopsis arenosa TaxID=1240361 RepID=A0A8T1YE26_9BRAS|nr:Zinc finger PMZ-type [Arabidopsis thaliana x Arabidopsis arenosa]